MSSGALPFSYSQLHFAFHLAQRKTLGAIGAQPEVLNFFMFCFLLVCVKAKKPASVEAHEGFGALRIGTL